MFNRFPLTAHTVSRRDRLVSRLNDPRTATCVGRAVAVSLTLAAIALVPVTALAQQPGGDVFGTSDQTLGNGIKAFLKYVRYLVFFAGFGFLAWGAINLGREQKYGNQMLGAIACFAFAAIGQVLYTMFGEGQEVQIDTDLGL
ncbi:MAG: hypothetical protein IT459_07225 [Planctomycetes bacterium]|nr:hypothetical protein [Planctomycetota bacterium]